MKYWINGLFAFILASSTLVAQESATSIDVTEAMQRLHRLVVTEGTANTTGTNRFFQQTLANEYFAARGIIAPTASADRDVNVVAARLQPHPNRVGAPFNEDLLEQARAIQSHYAALDLPARQRAPSRAMGMQLARLVGMTTEALLGKDLSEINDFDLRVTYTYTNDFKRKKQAHTDATCRAEIIDENTAAVKMDFHIVVYLDTFLAHPDFPVPSAEHLLAWTEALLAHELVHVYSRLAFNDEIAASMQPETELDEAVPLALSYQRATALCDVAGGIRRSSGIAALEEFFTLISSIPLVPFQSIALLPVHPGVFKFGTTIEGLSELAKKNVISFLVEGGYLAHADFLDAGLESVARAFDIGMAPLARGATNLREALEDRSENFRQFSRLMMEESGITAYRR